MMVARAEAGRSGCSLQGLAPSVALCPAEAPSSTAARELSLDSAALVWMSQDEAKKRWAGRFWGTPATSEETLARPRLDAECSDACACCGLARCSADDDIVYCDGCDGAYHQSCYEIPTIPEDDFYCRACAPNDSAPEPGEDDDALETALTTSGLDACVDFFVASTLLDRFRSPGLSLGELARACEAPVARVAGKPCAYEVLLRRSAGSTTRWWSKLSNQLVDLGFGRESRWVGADDEAAALSQVNALAPPERARLARLALEAAAEFNAEFRGRVRSTDDRFDRVGVDGRGRNYFVFQDDKGAFVVCRDDAPRPPMHSAKARQLRESKSKKKKKTSRGSRLPAPNKVPHKTPAWETLACGPSQLRQLIFDLSRSRDGHDLWLATTLRDKVAPHCEAASQTAKLEAKRQDRAMRRTKAAQNHLRFAGHDPQLVQIGPRKRLAVDYSFTDYDKQLRDATGGDASDDRDAYRRPRPSNYRRQR